MSNLSIRYGQALMHKVAGAAVESPMETANWRKWTERLFTDERERFRQMQSVWTRITPVDRQPQPAYVPLRAINLELNESDGSWLMNPGARGTDFARETRPLAADFQDKARNTETNFDRFYGLMQKYASTLPCTYGEDGVSLFRQWCMVSALMAIAGSDDPNDLPDSLGLIGMDLPGIQSTVYTITSRGAGKGVRGRSAFVQLLVFAIVDRLLKELDLCAANVLVNAGGNALILCGWTEGLQERLNQIERDINFVLFNGGDAANQSSQSVRFAGFKGDLSLALATVELPYEAVKYPVKMVQDEQEKPISLWQQYERELKERLGNAKQQPFRSLMNNEKGFETIFRPDPALTNYSCMICHRPEEKPNDFAEDPERPIDTSGQPIRACSECKGFEALARALAKRGVYLNRRQQPCAQTDSWQVALHAISGYWYSIDDKPASDALTLALSPDRFPASNVEGFRPLAVTTPINEDGQIVDNSKLADAASSSLKRLGVLKADVDNLAQILVNSLPGRSAALTATLSESLTLFFGGWLDKICQQEELKNKVYVLYAGGDDLLIIGTWDVMPGLARQIARDFERFTGHNPGVHLSAGLVLAGGKEPLYAAVEAADEALDQAKEYPPSARTPTKNAITFLGRTYAWSEFDTVIEWQERLVKLRNEGVPSSLITQLLTIYEQYRGNRGEIPGIAARGREGQYQNESLFLGPWLWKMVYGLTRLGRGSSQRSEIQAIQKDLLRAGAVEQMSTGARWAQFVTRKGGER